MRYFINFDKIINQLVPYFFGGRKLILYLQALVSPLRKVNDDFVKWTKKTRIDASMTSQVFKFEWYLNREFSKYFLSSGRIVIKNSEALGVPIYHQSANISDNENLILRKSDENAGSQTAILYRSDENIDTSSISFIVYTPQIDTRLISEEDYLTKLRFVIEKYRLANKTYIIKSDRI